MGSLVQTAAALTALSTQGRTSRRQYLHVTVTQLPTEAARLAGPGAPSPQSLTERGRLSPAACKVDDFTGFGSSLHFVFRDKPKVVKFAFLTPDYLPRLDVLGIYFNQ